MSGALKSLGWTRHFFFLLCLSFTLLSSVSNVGTGGEEVWSASSLPPLRGGNGAGEWDNIDNMVVHPASGRWDVTNSGYNATVQDAILNLTDVGDGTGDYYRIDRALSSFDSFVEIRFYVDSNGTVVDTSNSLVFDLYGSLLNTRMSFAATKIVDGNYSETLIRFWDVEAGIQVKNLTGSERVYEELWYKLRFDYDIYRSKFRFHLRFDNDTNVFDYYWQDINATKTIPELFDEEELNIRVYAGCESNGQFQQAWISYVEAKFDELDWNQIETPTDPQYLEDSLMGGYSEDDVDDWSKYEIIVPLLDTVEGQFTLRFNTTYLNNLDKIGLLFTLLGVDGNDGDRHSIVHLKLVLGQDDASRNYCSGIIDDGDWSPFREVKTFIGDMNTTSIVFAGGFTENRAEFTLRARMCKDPTDVTNPLTYEFVITEDVSTWVTDPSTEFVLQIWHEHSYTGYVDEIEAKTIVDSIRWASRESGRGLSPQINDPWTGTGVGPHPSTGGGGNDPLTILFKTLGAFIVGGLKPFLIIIDTVLRWILGGIGDILTEIGKVLTELLTLAGDIASAVWYNIESTLNFLTAAIAAIAGQIFTLLWDFAENLAALAFEILELLFVSLLALVDLIINLIAEAFFWLWDSMNLPDVLSWIEFALDFFVEFTTWAVNTGNELIQFLLDVSWIFLVVWWTWAVLVQFARANGNPLEGLGNFIEAWFADIIPIDILGIHVHVPQGIVFTLWLIAVLPSDFALWTAMEALG